MPILILIAVAVEIHLTVEMHWIGLSRLPNSAQRAFSRLTNSPPNWPVQTAKFQTKDFADLGKSKEFSEFAEFGHDLMENFGPGHDIPHLF